MTTLLIPGENDSDEEIGRLTGWFAENLGPDVPLHFNTPILHGCPYDCGLCPDHEQHSCLSIIEVTDACNLKCPVCYAESGPHRPGFRSLSQIEFMLDAENNYDLESSIRVAAELEELQFRWFEAPLMDYDLPGYRTLTALDQVPIIPSGNWIQDLTSFQHALDSKCWTEARTDVTMCGGFTGAQKYLRQVVLCNSTLPHLCHK